MNTLRYQVASPCHNSSSARSPSPSSEKKGMYKQPEHPLAALLWRFQLWISVTFALSVMEPWEKLLVIILVMVICGLMTVGLLRLLPQFIAMSLERTRYYVLG